MGQDTLYLIDGSGYIFRAFHGVRPLSRRDGTPTNAVFGVARMLLKLLREQLPRRACVLFDAGGPTFRHQLYAEYKANREAVPEPLVPQFPLVRQLVAAMGFAQLERPGFEADDLIGSLAAAGRAAGHPVVIVSGDKDMGQLLEPGVRLYDPMHDVWYEPGERLPKLEVLPEQVVDWLALAGDSSDNIPGVPRVGAKTAAKLLAEHGTLDAVLEAAQRDALKPPSVLASLKANRDQALLSRDLARIVRDVPDLPSLPDLTYGGLPLERLRAALEQLEFRQLGRELDGLSGIPGMVASAPVRSPGGDAPAGALEQARTVTGARAAQGQADTSGQGRFDFERPGDAPAAAARTDRPPERDPPVQPGAPSGGDGFRAGYRTITDAGELADALRACAAAGRFALDTETTSLDERKAQLVGLSLASAPGRAWYVPLRHHYLGVPPQLPVAQVLDALRPLVEDERLAKVGQNLKYDLQVLRGAGLELRGIADDAMIASYLLDPGRASHGLDSLARDFLGHENLRYDDLTAGGKQPFSEVPLEDATAYAAEDADVALRLADELRPRLQAAGMLALYQDLELPLVTVLADMEWLGAQLDPAALTELGGELQHRIADVERRARALVGEEVNIASPRQLGELLFGKLGLPHGRKTKSGYSTDVEVLEGLRDLHPLPAVVLEHRHLHKLRSTYVEALLALADRAGRVHTSFNQTRTLTGRLSSSDPNLQNIPVRDELGRRIRRAFVARRGWRLLSADYSQIELRVLAHLSGDPAFCAAFAADEDIHAATARELLSGGAAVTPEQRRRAKAINFGIVYGQSAFRLGQDLGLKTAEAQAFLERYFERYAGIRRYIDETIAAARQQGWVATMLGRRRYLAELSSANRNLRGAAERMAVNTTIQGSAADLIKVAMLRLHHALAAGGLRSRLVLQVHDELVLEVPVEEQDEALRLTVDCMQEAAHLSVPLKVDAQLGPNWAEAH